jgi:hypothetical protein
MHRETPDRILIGATVGDIVSLDMVATIDSKWQNVEMVWLTDADTENILRECVFETSIDGIIWVQLFPSHSTTRLTHS